MQEDNNKDVSKHPNKQQKFGKGRILTVLTLLFIICTATLTYVLIIKKSASPFPETIQKSVHFDLYYPTENKLNSSSIQDVDGTVSYTVNYKDSPMYVTIQAVPKDFDFTGLEKQIENSKSIRTPFGKAIIGTISERQIGSLKTDRSWLLITSTKDTPQEDIEAILRQLKKG